MSKSKGIFVTLEGGEGSGKTTVIAKLKDYLEKRSVPYIVTREPGGIEIAEKIREIILNPSHTAMDSRTEALLYAASRSQHLAEKVELSLGGRQAGALRPLRGQQPCLSGICPRNRDG